MKKPREKGRRAELSYAKEWRKLDPDAKRMPLSGAIEGLESDIFTILPFKIEIKNQERVSLWKWWEQAITSSFSKTPLLGITGNHREELVVLRFKDFVSFLKEAGYKRKRKKTLKINKGGEEG